MLNSLEATTNKKYFIIALVILHYMQFSAVKYIGSMCQHRYFGQFLVNQLDDLSVGHTIIFSVDRKQNAVGVFVNRLVTSSKIKNTEQKQLNLVSYVPGIIHRLFFTTICKFANPGASSEINNVTTGDRIGRDKGNKRIKYL